MREWLPSLSMAAALLSLVVFTMARVMGAHWNLLMAFWMLCVPIGALARGLAWYRGGLDWAIRGGEGALEARVHAAVRSTTWIVAIVAIQFAVIDVQLGAELGSVRAQVVFLGVAAMVGACVPLEGRTRLVTGVIGFIGLQVGWDVYSGISASSEAPVALISPFEEPAVVFHGGGSTLLNHHAAIQQQHDALDMVLAPDGSEVVGDATTLEGWACFGAPLRAPAAGSVVSVVSDLPDMPIGEVDRDNLAGNHVVVDLGEGLYLMMAHLKQGSVTAAEGDVLEAGQVFAQCGNSGNTSQPHLHIQVQTGPVFSNGDAELRTRPIAWASVDRRGTALQGAVAYRNDVVLP